MKKLLSCIVACAMMISILGINAYAAEREIQSEAPMITDYCIVFSERLSR